MNIKSPFWSFIKSMSPIGSHGNPSVFRIVIGLGNPGKQYSNSRHNVGFSCLDILSRNESIKFTVRHQKALVGEGEIEEIPTVLAKPRTFVNNSGDAVKYLQRRYKVFPQGFLVIYDDISLPFGKLRLRAKGGSGGHNGLRSIIESLGTDEFPRIRIGVGQPPAGTSNIDHVMNQMTPTEQSAANKAAGCAARAAAHTLTKGIEDAMNCFN